MAATFQSVDHLEDETTNLFDRIVNGWERSETDNGVFYYINHKSEHTAWDHPFLTKILEELEDHNEVKYAAYRTSLKLRHLQKRLYMHMVPLDTLDQVFVDQGYSHGSNDSILCPDLLSILTDMYTVTPDRRLLHDKAHIYAELLLNLLINLIDIDKTGVLSVLAVKIILSTLCKAKLAEKYKYFYQQLHDPSTFINRDKLAAFLEDMMQLPELLHENAAFGRDVDPAVASCLQMTNNMAGISEDVFLQWLFKEPQTLVWLPTLHRVAATESVTHEAKCNVCKAYPIVGFRYRCLKCFNFDMCQDCFFAGKIRKNHKAKHPIQEYCYPTSSKDDTKAFVKTVRNNLSRKHQDRSKVKYLPIEANHQFTSIEVQARTPPQAPDVSSRVPPDDEVQNRSEDSDASPQKKSPVLDSISQQRKDLESVIKQLEEENRQLYLQLADLKNTSDLDESVDKENQPTKVVSNKNKKNNVGSKSYGVSIQQTNGAPPAYQSPSIVLPLGLNFSHNRTSPISQNSSGSSSQSPVHVIPANNHDSLDSIEYADISPSRLSFPSFSKTPVSTEEEIELQQLAKRMDNIFPVTPSYSMSRTLDDHDEMLLAAADIGVAMTDFVSEAVHPYYQS
ncbi:hypothetical protein ScPMuIL_000108 [Solemya velum]